MENMRCVKIFLPFRIFIDNIDLCKQSLRREIQQKYKGSYFGILWNFIIPIITISVYTFVFGVVFESKWEYQVTDSLIEFALTLFAGVTIYSMFSECVVVSPSLVVSNVNFVKKVVFPLEILSIISTGGMAVQVGANLTIILLGKIIFMRTFDLMFLFFPLVLLPLVFLVLGISWSFSALGVFFRDMRPISSMLTLLFAYLTPVFYPLSAVPEELRGAMYLNPLTVIVDNARKVLIYGQLPDFIQLAIVTIISYIIALIGLGFFRKLKPNFADML